MGGVWGGWGVGGVGAGGGGAWSLPNPLRWCIDFLSFQNEILVRPTSGEAGREWREGGCREEGGPVNRHLPLSFITYSTVCTYREERVSHQGRRRKEGGRIGKEEGRRKKGGGGRGECHVK